MVMSRLFGQHFNMLANGGIQTVRQQLKRLARVYHDSEVLKAEGSARSVRRDSLASWRLLMGAELLVRSFRFGFSGATNVALGELF